ncbi:adenylate/guanylate cyclase catalytic domain protein [Leptospira borgpetersenii str. 200701203]|uniref:Adenylate/guanylate cyclase catalytic domain protein n=1 Tax=Leptospira borgpetersenii str. 200701203 TaxID=1193007 RepID=M3HR56_LEPBO|nr:adenylate/guanylate cyclase catalytic domain protein [Leptospira borgpetersenii str. 200701203]
MLSILPETVAEELKKNDFVVPIRYESVTVLFTDMAGFTKIAETMSPEELLNELDLFFGSSIPSLKITEWKKSKRSETPTWPQADFPL